jgi:hypothetical protein
MPIQAMLVSKCIDMKPTAICFPVPSFPYPKRHAKTTGKYSPKI